MFEEYKQLLKEFISFKTVSSDPSCKEDIKKAAEWLAKLLTRYRMKAQLIEGYGNPFVIGEYNGGSEAETALVYGHYDEQPAEKGEGWDTNPFELEEKDGKLFARGVMDDKGQLLMHIVTIGNLIREGKLAYHVKFLLEGEEENGSPHIERFVQDHRKELSCDFALLSDGELILGNPTIELGNRGIVNFTLTLQTATNELHSGIYGGAAPNAIHELAKIIDGLFDTQNHLTIEKLYDDVDTLDTTVMTPFDFNDYQYNTGAQALLTENNVDFHTATGQRPALTVISIDGGYQGEGYKTTIPPKATAKFNLRIVKSQDPQRVAEIIKKHFAKIIPDYVAYTLSFDEFAKPNKTDPHTVYVKRAEKILEALFGKKVVHKYVGGTEPAISVFQEYLQKPVLSVPFANEDGHMHGVNENFDIENIQKGMEFSRKFFGGN